MNILIAICVLIYGIIFGGCFFYLRSDLSNRITKRKRENICSVLMIVNSLILVITAFISVAYVFGWVNDDQTLILFGIAMLQLCIFEEGHLRNKSKLIYLSFGIIFLLVNTLIVTINPA